MRDTVTVSLPPGIRRELDRIAAREGVSRSEVLRASLEDYLFVRRFRALRQRMMAQRPRRRASSRTRTSSTACREARPRRERPDRGVRRARRLRRAARVLRSRARAGHVAAILEEVRRNLVARSRSRAQADQTVRLLRTRLEVVRACDPRGPGVPGPDDDVVLGTAIAGRCDAIVPGHGPADRERRDPSSRDLELEQSTGNVKHSGACPRASGSHPSWRMPGRALRATDTHTTAGSSGVPDHFGARFSQPLSVTATVSSWRMPSSPGM